MDIHKDARTTPFRRLGGTSGQRLADHAKSTAGFDRRRQWVDVLANLDVRPIDIGVFHYSHLPPTVFKIQNRFSDQCRVKRVRQIKWRRWTTAICSAARAGASWSLRSVGIS
jgi:hypothetical protein